MKKDIMTSNARYLEIIFPWDEDLCSFQSDFDLESDEIPYVSNGYWHGIIDLKEHRLCDSKDMDWPYVLNAKVCDGGVYFLLDESKKALCIYRGYVSDLPFDNKSWGDYIHLVVRDGGHIEYWEGDFDLDDFTKDANTITIEEYEALKRMYLKTTITEPSPDENKMLEKAARLMLEMHKGQTDKSGQPYFLHPMRVVLNCETPNQKIVAFLHDILEDTPMTSDNLKELGFSSEVIKAIQSVTHKKGENYDEFIARCSLNHIGRYVKMRDLEDNLNVTRLQKIDSYAADRINRYLKALRFLKKADQINIFSGTIPSTEII